MTDARALRAQGIPITLLDGREARLIFDLEALAQVEQDFGSLGGMQEVLVKMQEEGANARLFGPVLKLMQAALLHDPSCRNARFDTALIGDYFRATMEAVNLSFPQLGAASDPAQSPPLTDESAETADSHGPIFTISAP